MSIKINDNFSLRAPKPVDDRAGSFSGGVWNYPSSVAAFLANTAITPYRYPSMTATFMEGGVQNEYWFVGGVADADFKLKLSSTPAPDNLQEVTTGVGNNITDNVLVVSGQNNYLAANALPQVSLLFNTGLVYKETGVTKGTLSFNSSNLFLTSDGSSSASSLAMQGESSLTAGANFNTRLKISNSLLDDEAITQGQVNTALTLKANVSGQIFTGNISAPNLSGTNTGDQDLSGYQLLSEKGQPNGYTGLDSGAKIPLINLPDSILGQVKYVGTWNASTNTPTLISPPASTTKGDYYITSVAGTQFGISFLIGDWIISNGTSWDKVDNTDAVMTVFGRVGNILANASDYSAFYPLMSGSYVNPTWIESLPYSKITGTPNLSVYELLANKQNSLTVDGTGAKYPTVDTINALNSTLLHTTGNETKNGRLTLNSPAGTNAQFATGSIAPLIVLGGNGGNGLGDTGSIQGGSATPITITAGNGGLVSGLTTSSATSGSGSSLSFIAGSGGDILAPNSSFKLYGQAGTAVLQAGHAYGTSIGGNTEIKSGNNLTSSGVRGGSVFIVAGYGNNNSTDNPVYNGSIFMGVSAASQVRGNTIIGSATDDYINRFQVTGDAKITGKMFVTATPSTADEVIRLSDLTTALSKKQIISSGLIKNGAISINVDPTKYNISAGIGVISNFDDPENPITTMISFSAIVGHTPAYLNTGNITYVAINSSGSIVESATPFTMPQRRDLIILGAVIHSNLTTINVVNNISAPTNASTNQLHDFMEAVGALNITGNKYSANGANLQLNKSAGSIFKLGINFAIDWKNPHVLSQSSGTALTFRYRTQNGTEGSDVTNLDPSKYDLSNVLTSVPNNKFSIQTVTMFQTGLTRIQYGQNFYDDLASAQAAIFTREFNAETNIKENGITRAYIILKNNATSLLNASDTKIVEAQKFGGVASGGIAVTSANIIAALGYTPENVANKSTTLTSPDNTKYPTTLAVSNSINLQAVTDGGSTTSNGISIASPGQGLAYLSLNNTSSGKNWRFQSGKSGVSSIDFYLRNETDNFDGFKINSNGNFQIGYETDQGYRFAVNGTGFFAGDLTLNKATDVGVFTQKTGGKKWFAGSETNNWYLQNVTDGIFPFSTSSSLATFSVPVIAPTFNGYLNGNAATATNSTQWNTQSYSGSDLPVSTYLMAYQGSNTWGLASLSSVRSFLGSPSGGETLQSAYNRDENIQVADGESVNIKANLGANALKIWGRSDGLGYLQFMSNNGLSNYGSIFGSPTYLGFDAPKFSFETGNVGIGTTTVPEKLTVAGSGSFSARLNVIGNSADVISQIENSNSSGLGVLLRAASGANYALLAQNYDGSADLFRLNGNGNATFSGSVTASSYSGGATLTGTPTAPTATAGTNTTQIATTQHVHNVITGNNTTPSITIGASGVVGTGASISIAGNNIDGVITLVTGTGMSSGGSPFSIIFAGGFAYPVKCTPVIQVSNDGTTLKEVLYPNSLTTNSWAAGTINTLTASQTYQWNYHVGGY